MAINRASVNQTQIYKRALSAEEKRRMKAISPLLTKQTGDQTEQNREQAYTNVQTIKQLLQENRQQKAENSDTAAAQKTANLQNDNILKSSAQTQKNAALLLQPTTKTSGLTAAAPVELKDYTWWNWMGDNDMTTMNDEDKLSWQAAMAGW